MKDRPLRHRSTDELKTLLQNYLPIECRATEDQKVRINEIRYELNLRLNPVMRALAAMFGEVRP